ncbi:hypothetical protein ACFLV5_02325 [Chloroflexota bacterium]
MFPKWKNGCARGLNFSKVHLDSLFINIMDNTVKLIREDFQTKNNITLPIAGTGSAVMESFAKVDGRGFQEQRYTARSWRRLLQGPVVEIDNKVPWVYYL